MNLHARRPRIRANMGVSFLEKKSSAIKGNCSNKKTFNEGWPYYIIILLQKHKFKVYLTWKMCINFKNKP